MPKFSGRCASAALDRRGESECGAGMALEGVGRGAELTNGGHGGRGHKQHLKRSRILSIVRY